MSLIPALLRGMAHYRAERERLNKRGKDPYSLDIGEELDFGPGLELGEAGDEIARSFQRLGVMEGLPANPTLRTPKTQYPQYKPPSG
jgi:hypothetical protein